MVRRSVYLLFVSLCQQYSLREERLCGAQKFNSLHQHFNLMIKNSLDLQQQQQQQNESMRITKPVPVCPNIQLHKADSLDL